MNKKFLSALLLGALTVTSTGTLVSCKDYDDDITNLQEQIDKNAKAIKEINDLIAKGGVITGTTSVEGGVKVTLSNGNEFTIKNGENGAKGDPGVSWTIGKDGFWYKDGEKTEYKALGQDGKPGQDATASGENGKYYVPNATTGKFDIYKDGKLVESTNISFIGPNVITAVKDDAKKTLTLFGVEGGSGENKAVVISMSGTLSSLSYRPGLYLDGIETIEYPWLSGVAMKTVPASVDKNFQGKLIHGLKVSDYVADNTKPFVYGPAWAVEYDASPWNAAVTEDDLAGYNVLNPTAIYNTRAAVAALGAVTSPAYAFPGKDGGKKLFSMNNGTGVLTTGLQIENPDKFTSETPTNGVRNDVNTVALRVKNSEGTEVVADYALVQPEKTIIDGMIWSQTPKRIDENGKEAVRSGDWACSYFPTDAVHVWASPMDALKDTYGAALSLYFEDEVGVDLSKYVAVRLVKSKNLKANEAPEYVTVSPEEALQWGLTFHYNIINYQLGDNKTSESMFLKKVNANANDTDGRFRAANVDENKAIGEPANASVGRLPLVQVTVTNNNGDIVLDGYILLYISKTAEPNGKNELWTEQETKFDPCNANVVFETTWNQFNALMLTQYLDMTKETFDHQYEPDLLYNGTMVQYANFKEKGEQEADYNALGDVFYIGETEGSTNHTWKWVIPADKIEAKLHHKDFSTFTTWVRFKAKDKKSAKYPYIYVKLTAKVNNKVTNTYAFGDKNANYWFDAETGDDNGWSAVVFDVLNPFDGGDIELFNRSVRSTLTSHTVKVDGVNVEMNIERLKDAAGKVQENHRYYFVPKEVSITALNGTKYTLTPKHPTEHPNYDKIFCKYVDTDKHNYSEAASVMEKCAIDANSGAYANSDLYAVANGEYTKIATIDKTSGLIKLINNDQCDDVLNAIGYEKDHKNINKEMRAFVGIVAATICDVVEKTTDNEFLVSWQRPINVEKLADVAVDANTNGNIINLIDILKMYDWRGPVNGKMYDGNEWFWAYYGVNAITVNTDPKAVLTNMHNGSSFKPLSEVTTEAELYTLLPNGSTMKGEHKFTFNLSTYNKKARNADLVQMMTTRAKDFGRLYYTNNGDNVTEFDVIIPVTLSYTWGDFVTNVTIHINRTLGN